MRHILHGRRFRLAFKVLGYNHSGRAQRRRHDRGMKLLLVEDDFDLAGALSRSLVARGFEVLCCADGKEALAAARRTAFDVITLDLSLPGLDGLEVLRRLRDGGSTTPVLALTARAAVTDRVAGLEAGADDYLAKPFDLDELVARLRALTRRVGRDGQLRCGALHRDPASGAFYNEALPLELSQREAELLRLLMSRIDRVVSKEELRTQVFANTDEQVQADAVEVVVHRLRKKLVGTNAEIVTLRGVGYLLCDADSMAAQKGDKVDKAEKGGALR
ncbi:Transcriptional regulatory protein tctD [compost metagenome]